MNYNLHKYEFEKEDIAFIIDNLNIRWGIVQNYDNNSVNYSLLMSDNNQIEQYNYDNMFATYSHAYIYRDTFLLTPTPTPTPTISPSMTRTPRPSSTPTITPSSEATLVNLLDTSKATWVSDNGSVDILSSDSIKFITGTKVLSTKFTCTISIKANVKYDLSFIYAQGTCRNLIINTKITPKAALTIDYLNEAIKQISDHHHDSGIYSRDISTNVDSDLTITITLFNDSFFDNNFIEKELFYILRDLRLTYSSYKSSVNYNDIIIGDGATNYWPFDTTNPLVDLIAGDNLTENGSGLSLVPDSYGNVAQFTDNTNSYFSLQNTIQLTNSYSLETWIYLDSDGTGGDGYPTIFGDSRSGYYGVQFDNSGGLWIYTDKSSSTGIVTYSYSNEWVHVVLTVDSSNIPKFYVNGVYFPSLNYFATGETTPFSMNIDYLGSNGDAEEFKGKLGNVAIYNGTVLSPTQVQAHYNAGINTSGYRYPMTIVVPPTPLPTPSPSPIPNYYLGKMKADGTFDVNYQNNIMKVNGPVTSLYKNGSNIFLGGGGYSGLTMNNIEGQNYTRFALLSSQDGTLSTTSFPNLAPNNDVKAFLNTTTSVTYIGGSFDYIGGYSYMLARLNPDYTVDNTYTPPSISGTFNTLIEDNNNKIWVGGNFNSVNGDVSQAYLTRLNSDGTLDGTFTGLNLNNYVTDIIQTADGKYLISGNFTNIGTNNYSYILRLNTDGTLDNTFPNLSISATVLNITQLSNGKIMIGGSFTYVSGNNSGGGVYRLNSDGTADTTFANLGGSISGSTASIIELGTGQIVLGGSYDQTYSSYNGVVLLNADGTISSSATKYTNSHSIDVDSIVELDSGDVIFGISTIT